MHKNIRLTNKKYMLDFKSNLILKIIINECKDGGYKLLEKSDLISCLPSKYKIDEGELDKIIYGFEKDELISLRYDDEKIYCVCTLPKATKIVETQKNNTIVYKFNYLLFFILSFFACFVSSFLSGIILNLIF